MKILALYGSRFGQAEAVLRRVADALRDASHDVVLTKADTIPHDMSLDDFEGVVVAASVIMGRYQSYVRKWARSHASALARIPNAFISVNGHSPETSPEWRASANGYVAKFIGQTGWRPRWTGMFSGALRYTRYGTITRWIMKRIARSEGGPTDTSRDYEFTDWEAVDRFAEELARHLSAAEAATEPVTG